MSRKLLILSVIACLLIAFSSSLSYAGIEPSPWQPTLIQKINLNIQRLQPLAQPGLPTSEKSGVIIDHMSSILNQPTTGTSDNYLAARTMRVVDRVTAVLFNPQPEPPAFDPLLALDAIDKLITMGFDPGNNVYNQALMAVNILGRITNGLFNPQPEPPAMEAYLNIVQNISSLVVNTEVGYERQLMMEMRAFNKITAAWFNSQYGGPAFNMLQDMFDIIDWMEILHDPHGP
jgi:hypothetical protein